MQMSVSGVVKMNHGIEEAMNGEKKIIDGYSVGNFVGLTHFYGIYGTSSEVVQRDLYRAPAWNVQAYEIALNRNTHVQKYTKINKYNAEIR